VALGRSPGRSSSRPYLATGLRRRSSDTTDRTRIRTASHRDEDMVDQTCAERARTRACAPVGPPRTHARPTSRRRTLRTRARPPHANRMGVQRRRHRSGKGNLGAREGWRRERSLARLLPNATYLADRARPTAGSPPDLPCRARTPAGGRQSSELLLGMLKSHLESAVVSGASCVR